jgi:poly-beta-1,6-N-acetyl-D-glucosamine biosynthesis protein PgaD
MHVSSFIILVCAVVLVGWSAIWLRCRVSERRRRARQAEWEELARHYSDLDRELDEVWHRR